MPSSDRPPICWLAIDGEGASTPSEMSKIASREPLMPTGERGEEQGRSPTVGGGVAESRPFRAAIAEEDPPDLAEALEDLNCMVEMAQDEGCPVPTNAMLKVAEAQLRRLYGFAPAQYMVGPGPDGEIIAYARPQLYHSIALTLFADGGAFCSVRVPDEKLQFSRPAAGEITDAEFRQAADLLARALGHG